MVAEPAQLCDDRAGLAVDRQSLLQGALEIVADHHATMERRDKLYGVPGLLLAEAIIAAGSSFERGALSN